ncbi:MAG: alpha-1,4-glucan--maltose-1-phosphate maltosyltransferase [Chloroflexia bacterium]|nr:alpha-1,4-glucan--maltose-1-phosphate maltosyltransferase [Chloroflexia bacterium]
MTSTSTLPRTIGATIASPPSSILIESVLPQIDGGRYPVKREVGDVLHVTADIFREGHEHLAAVLKVRDWQSSDWDEFEMTRIDNDRWGASVSLDRNTRLVYAIEAFPDRYGTWTDEIAKKLAAGLDVASEILEGRQILDEIVGRAGGDAADLIEALDRSEAAGSQADAVEALLTTNVVAVVGRHRSRAGKAVYPVELTVIVDRVAARYAAWYSMFPRSAGTVPGQGATFRDVIDQLPRVQAMGFDVLYFTPIHPIGTTNRKGKNNTLNAKPEDPGVPYAIGSDAGGHDAINPSLGTEDDFRELIRQAAAHGIEIAMDLAIQASPDHPWAKDHPEWFFIRPDGTIKYAENPPKKYQDIYPVNFQNADWESLWHEMKRIMLVWIDWGVKTIRVDNPHTKPTAFWEWLITEIHRDHPDVIFLSEAFTRPKVMKALAKVGFAQSYTYFTWRNFKREITDYLIELTATDVKEYLRGNFFTNTHDILPYVLQEGGRPAFKIRLVLAATLSSVYGIYSGYELCENTPVPGKEEYLNSEKYEFKVWDWDRPGNIVEYVTAINRIRREHPALHEYDNLRFHDAADETILCYSKSTPDHADTVVMIVNLDPFQPHETVIVLPIGEWGIGDGEQYRATDLLSGETFMWTGARQTVFLDPRQEPAMMLSIQRWAHVEFTEPCF